MQAPDNRLSCIVRLFFKRSTVDRTQSGSSFYPQTRKPPFGGIECLGTRVGTSPVAPASTDKAWKQFLAILCVLVREPITTAVQRRNIWPKRRNNSERSNFESGSMD